MDDYQALEEAVWASAAADSKTAEQLRAALSAFRAKRGQASPQGGVLKRMLQSPATLVSTIVAIGGMTFQQCSAASERRLQRAKSHLEVRAAFIDSYVNTTGEDWVKRAQILRAANGLGSTMLECGDDEVVAAGLALMDWGDGAAQRSECEDRGRFALWVKEEIKRTNEDIARSQTVRSDAELAVATQQAESGDEGGSPSPAQSKQLVDEERQRIQAQLTLNDVQPQPRAAAQSAPSSDRLTQARAAWQDGYRAYQQNDRKGAREGYERALAIKSDYFAALNSLGRMELEDGGSVKTAISYYERALKSNPDYAPALYNIAIAYAKQDDLKACAALKSARDKAPNYANSSRVEDLVRDAVQCPPDAVGAAKGTRGGSR